MEVILSLLNSYSIILVIATVMIIAFAKCITKIFRMGVTFKSDLATKTDQREFEEEIRRDMRGYALQIQKSVTDSILVLVENRLKDIEDAKQAAADIKIIKAQLDVQIKSINEKVDAVKEVSDTVRVLNNKVQRLEYGQAMAVKPTNDRRSEN